MADAPKLKAHTSMRDLEFLAPLTNALTRVSSRNCRTLHLLRSAPAARVLVCLWYLNEEAMNTEWQNLVLLV